MSLNLHYFKVGNIIIFLNIIMFLNIIISA